MFKIAPNPTFTVPVSIHVPGADAPGTINITYKFLDPEQLKSWQSSQGNKPLVDSLHEVVMGWSGVEDATGSVIEFSKENFNAVLNKYHTAAEDITRAYLQEILGAKRKN